MKKISNSTNPEVRRPNHGFTLLELMITVAVVGILAAIAYPTYMDQIRKARRTEATSGLMEAANREEFFMSNNGTYTATIGAGGLGMSATTTPDGFYTLDAPVATATAYTLRATPVAGTSQATDPCGNFTLTSTGVQGVSGTDDNCW